jgi:hypothetical protein
LAPELFIFRFGFGLLVAQLTNLVLSAVTTEEAGQASGLNGTIREVGRSLGAAIIGAVFIGTFISVFTTNLEERSLIPESVKTTPATILNDTNNQYALVAFAQSANLPQPVKDGITLSLNHSNVAGGKQALLITAIFVTVAFGLSFALPKKVFGAE